MNRLINQIKIKIKGGSAMMINYFAMQINLGWITLEEVPKRYRAKVAELVEMSNIGNSDEPASK
ncbi:hypothetical protein D8798_01030 [Streptococcus cristatus]|uniref:Phage protein n=1 Tax=Streptococcus cristatus TaxID=45634 RepID=A0A3R9KTF3_STRCR|nr:hypothetical protein D8798_01030 [Streptococcus cristatus]